VETVTQITTGEDADPARRAIYDLAHQVAAAPADITADDLQPLRKGFADDEILDVVLTAAIRCFFSSVLSATGAEPDPSLTDQDPALRGVLLSRHC
jgi:alkylhydroperoxidase family enzyme